MLVIIFTWGGRLQSAAFSTARKRSLGQGNVFTGVCLSTGSWLPSMHHRLHDPVGRPWGSVSRGVCPTLLDADPPDADYLDADLPDADPPQWDTTGYSQQAGITHPTGMHSCLNKNFFVLHHNLLLKIHVFVFVVGFPFGSGIYELMGKVTVFAILGVILLLTSGKILFPGRSIVIKIFYLIQINFHQDSIQYCNKWNHKMCLQWSRKCSVK